MGGLFWGAFLGVIAIVAITIAILVFKFRRLRKTNPGIQLLSEFAKGIASGELDFEVPEEPKSLNLCDKLLIPKILRDFPDFDPDEAKTLFRDFLRQQYRAKKSFQIHSLGFSEYRRSGIQKTIVMQAAACYMNGSAKLQIRCTADYMYRVDTADESIAANCPNCGGALGYGVVVCPYCDSRVANVMNNTWQFINLRET